ncbi:site-specific integrase [Ensifer sp. BR816]|uniref:tyrosine-type recombinase/integrase n=1 Tax=Rhizobium sp. (strain BR816) TaxID=1057002 RepID=UPI000374CA1A|nr:site-specific integrase [Ensifer sp. BR816]
MPRKSKGARLHLRKARSGRPAAWVILDGATERSTGCGEDDRGGAEKALERYLAEKHRPDWRQGDPAEVKVADVIAFYCEQRAPELAHPELVAWHMTHLLAFFGDRTCDVIDGTSCRAYRKSRETGKIGRRAVTAGTARRELETLQAALSFAYKEKKLIYPVPVTLPPKAPSRQRWLTRSEAARLLAGALGIVPVALDVETREPAKWGRMFKPVYHVARFILIGLYTGTRHEAILGLRWGVNSDGGWFDLDRGILYRRGEGQAETNKRRTPAPIPENLIPHVQRWRRITVKGPVEFAGRLIKKERRGWDRARVLADLGDDVTPHVMKHTCITWMLQREVPVWEVAGFTGTSEKIIDKVYGHHSPHHLQAAKQRFHGRNLGNQ